MIYHFKRDRVRQLIAPLLHVIRNTVNTNRELTIMFHVGRCGSTVLGDLMHQHPQVYWDGEILPFLFLNRSTNETSYKDLNEGLWKRHIKDRKYLAPGRSFGIEIKFFHCDWLGITIPELLEELKEFDKLNIIVLERQNLLRSIVSHQLALQNGTWHNHQTSNDRSIINRVNINPNDLFQDHEKTTLIKTLTAWSKGYIDLKNYLELEKKEHLWLTYEGDIENDPTMAYRKILALLGLKNHTPIVKFKKNDRKKLVEIIENYPRLEDYLNETSFKWMLAD